MITMIRRRLDDDAGLGMILVIGIMVFVAGLTVTASIIAQNALGQSRQRINFERSLAAAESGIDYALGHLQYAFDVTHTDYPLPLAATAPNPDCDAASVQLPDFTSVDEKQWARTQLKSLLVNHPKCLHQDAGRRGHGPQTEERLWWSRSPVRSGVCDGVLARSRQEGIRRQDDQGRVRLHALSAAVRDPDGQLADAQSTSTDVMGAHGVDPALASVHTSGDLTVIGQPHVTGSVTYGGAATGSFGNFGGGTESRNGHSGLRRDPAPSQRSRVLQPSGGPRSDGDAAWIDLCPDGKAPSMLALGTTLVPWTGQGDDPYNGWSYKASTHTWTASKDTPPGEPTSSTWPTWPTARKRIHENFSVIASSTSSDCASKLYGESSGTTTTPSPRPSRTCSSSPTAILSATSNFYSGQSAPGKAVISGMYVAGEEIQIWTSSSGLVGSVLAANQCPRDGVGADDTGPVTSNEVQGQIIKFDPNGDSPFSSLISTTLWLEYVG